MDHAPRSHSAIQLGDRTAPWRRFPERHSVLLGLVGLTLVLELAIVIRSPVIAPDGLHFIAMAHDLEHEPLAVLRKYDQHPAYPAMVLAARRTLLCMFSGEGYWVSAARLVSAAFGVLGVVVVWLLARQIADATIAHVSALLYALLPVLRQNAADALSDTPHLVLYLASTLLVCCALARKSTWLFFAAGACSGLAFLIRPEGLSVAIVATLLAVALPRWRRQFGWRRSLVTGAAIAAGAALLVIPYVMSSGKFTSKITSKAGWQATHPATSPASLPTRAASTAARIPPAPTVITKSRKPSQAAAAPTLHFTPLDYTAPVERTSWGSALLDAVGVLGERLGECLRWVLLAPLAIGSVVSLRRKDAVPLHFLWALSLFHIALVLLLYCLSGYIDRRHLMPLVSLLLPAISIGLVSIAQSARRIAFVRTHPRTATSIGCLALVLLLAPRTLRPLHETHQHKLVAARVLDEFAAAGDTVISNSNHVIYYASLRGKLAGGVGLRNGVPDDGPMQAGGHRFAVIEQGGEQFHSAWCAELETTYAPIARIPADAAFKQSEIVIYERRSEIAHAVLETRHR